MISNAPGGSAAVAIEELEKMHFMERRSCKTMWFKRWTGIWDSRLWFCEALFDAQEGDDPNRAELEPLRGHSVTQQDYCLDTTLTTANRVQFCCCASEDDDPLCEGAARCASVSIATLGYPGSRFKRPLAYRGSIHSGHDLTECNFFVLWPKDRLNLAGMVLRALLVGMWGINIDREYLIWVTNSLPSCWWRWF